MSRKDGVIVRSTRQKSTKELGSYVSNTLKDLGDKSPLLGWVHDMYSMASKAQRNISKVFKLGSKTTSSSKEKKKAPPVKVSVPKAPAYSKPTGVGLSFNETVQQRRPSNSRLSLASSSVPTWIDQEEHYDVPEFVPPYETTEVHPLTAQFVDVTKSWLEQHHVDIQVGPKVWEKLLEEKIPYLAGYVYVDTRPKEFLWCCKYVSLIVALDYIVDEPEKGEDPNKVARLMLELNTVLMWFLSEDPQLRQQLKPLFSCFAVDKQDAVINSFSKSLAHAYTSSRSGLMALEIQPIASAFRELWLEYSESVPYECNVRMARYIQNYLLGCVGETKNRQSQSFPTTLRDYIPLRRQSVGIEPLIVVTDLFIKARQWPDIPNWFFYGPHMQRLLRAVCDVVAWHNDVYSFPKEVLKRGDPHNLVFVISQEHGCSYIEAAIHAMEMIHNRINDLERAASYLQVDAPYSCRNCVEEYARICRQWVTGSHQFHITTKRYNEEHRVI